MKQYRIYTERKRVKDVCSIVSDHFGGFTVYEAIGYWRGTKEKSMVIEILSDFSTAEYHVIQLCKKIKGLNRQDAVMYTVQDVKMTMWRA